MNDTLKKWIFVLRISMGWLFFYAGITKVINPEWSAAGYLNNAQTFKGLFAWFASEGNIGWVNFVNEWGLTLIGVALILGAGVRYATIAGVLLMLLYYFPILDFPHAGTHSYIIDDHLVYALALIVLCYAKAGQYIGLESKFPKLR